MRGTAGRRQIAVAKPPLHDEESAVVYQASRAKVTAVRFVGTTSPRRDPGVLVWNVAVGSTVSASNLLIFPNLRHENAFFVYLCFARVF